MAIGKCLTIGLRVIWEEEGKSMESVAYYDIDVAKSGDNRSTWMLRNESNHYGHCGTDRRTQVKPIT